MQVITFMNGAIDAWADGEGHMQASATLNVSISDHAEIGDCHIPCTDCLQTPVQFCRR